MPGIFHIARALLRPRTGLDDPNFLPRLAYEQGQWSAWFAMAAGLAAILRLLMGQPVSNLPLRIALACVCKACERNQTISEPCNGREEHYLIVACTVITDVPEAVDP